MTWTYGKDPSKTPRDEVRFLVGDIDETNPQVSDEEIAYALAESASDVHGAAASILEHLAVVYARLAEVEQLGRRRNEYGDRSAKYKAQAAEVKVAGGVDAAGPTAPQIRAADRDTALGDTTRTPTQFTVGMMRNTGT